MQDPSKRRRTRKRSSIPPYVNIELEERLQGRLRDAGFKSRPVALTRLFDNRTKETWLFLNRECDDLAEMEQFFYRGLLAFSFDFPWSRELGADYTKRAARVGKLSSKLADEFTALAKNPLTPTYLRNATVLLKWHTAESSKERASVSYSKQHEGPTLAEVLRRIAKYTERISSRYMKNIYAEAFGGLAVFAVASRKKSNRDYLRVFIAMLFFSPVRRLVGAKGFAVAVGRMATVLLDPASEISEADVRQSITQVRAEIEQIIGKWI